MENMVPTLDIVPVGFRFRPTDEELVDYYLKHKLLDDDYPIYIIPDIDLCKVEPWHVPGLSMIKSDDPEWFFFSPIDYKYANSKRFNRQTESGFWKATGNDRNIKSRETNRKIGTKKTLVFHEGPVPGNRTSWVIHEYHATTFPEIQRTFVLCRLMKKPEKTHKRGIDAMVCDEAEPSRQIAYSDNENQATDPEAAGDFPEMNVGTIFQEIHQTEKYCPTISSIGIEQETSFPNSPLLNAYFRNEKSNMQTPSEITEEDDEFVKSLWAQEPNLNEGSHAFVSSSTQLKSLRRVYNESSITDVEVVSTLHDNVVDSWAVETSSCDSTTDKPLEINCIEISSSPSTLKRWNTQYHPRQDNLISKDPVSYVESQKELTLESEKDLKNSQNTNSRVNFESGSHQSSDVNRKGSFISLETHKSSESLQPRSVYLVNVVIGILLLIVISWDVLSS